MAHHAVPVRIPRFELFEEPNPPLILCVDDNEAILEVLSEILTLNGYRVKCEADPSRACRWLRSADVDAVVVDYDMPGLNGSQLARMIRRDKPQIPVLMFSGTTPDAEALDAVWAFVSKNLGIEPLMDALRTKLANS